MSEFVMVQQPEKPITEIYAWIATDRDGNEGILSGDYETPFGKRILPLLSHIQAQAEDYKEAAAQAQADGARAGCFFEVSLVTFTRKP